MVVGGEKAGLGLFQFTFGAPPYEPRKEQRTGSFLTNSHSNTLPNFPKSNPLSPSITTSTNHQPFVASPTPSRSSYDLPSTRCRTDDSLATFASKRPIKSYTDECDAMRHCDTSRRVKLWANPWGSKSVRPMTIQKTIFLAVSVVALPAMSR